MDLKRPETLRPYVSLDLETTGLDTQKSKIIQVSMVLDIGGPLENLPHITFFVNWGRIDYSEPYALGMNGWIFKQITGQEKAKYPIYYPEAAGGEILNFLRSATSYASSWDEKYGIKSKGKIQLAGKNIANFDYPLLLSNFFMQGLDGLVDHRFLDAGAVYSDIFGRNPGLETINKLIGHKSVTHEALDDALNVVSALRWRFENPWEREWTFSK